MSQINQFKPDYAVSPGAILNELLEERDISQAELAKRCGRPEKTISLIVNGSHSIMADTALQFERALGISADVWLNLESTYKIWKQRMSEQDDSVNWSAWVQKFPLYEMVARKIMPAVNSVHEKGDAILKFFGVSSINAFQEYLGNPIEASLRHSSAKNSDPYALCVWLREGELKAKVPEEEYDKERFTTAVQEIRALTTLSINDAAKKTKALCLASGVALEFVPAYRNVPVSGVARWIRNGRHPLIQLSLRGKTNDLFWFSFFHECAHILKHPKRKIYIDDGKTDTSCAEEIEADTFARNTMISPRQWASFVEADDYTSATIRAFASEIEIHPGIVVGRLHREKLLPYNRLHNLKQGFKFNY